MTKNLVAFAQALRDETRWRIIQLVFNEPMCVCDLFVGVKYCVSIVRNNSKGRTYIGLSEDVVKRVVDHNDGVSKWTKHR